jgi:hypothetical protein
VVECLPSTTKKKKRRKEEEGERRRRKKKKRTTTKSPKPLMKRKESHLLRDRRCRGKDGQSG